MLWLELNLKSRPMFEYTGLGVNEAVDETVYDFSHAMSGCNARA